MSHEDLTTKEVAERMNTTAPTVAKMCAAGELAGAYRLTNKKQSAWRIPPEAIEEHRRRRAGAHVPRSHAWREAALDAA